MKKPLIIFVVCFLCLLSPFIYLFGLTLIDSLPSQHQAEAKISKKIPALIDEGVVWVYLPKPRAQKISSPIFLDWGNAIRSKKKCQFGNWVAFNLPNENYKLCSIPTINGQELDLAPRQLKYILKKYCEGAEDDPGFVY